MFGVCKVLFTRNMPENACESALGFGNEGSCINYRLSIMRRIVVQLADQKMHTRTHSEDEGK